MQWRPTAPDAAGKIIRHCRVGFENNLELANGRLAKDNAELVQTTARLVMDLNGKVADSDFARRLFPEQ